MNSIIENSDFSKSRRAVTTISAVVIIYSLASIQIEEINFILFKGVVLRPKFIDWILMVILLYQSVVFLIRSNKRVSEEKLEASRIAHQSFINASVREKNLDNQKHKILNQINKTSSIIKDLAIKEGETVDGITPIEKIINKLKINGKVLPRELLLKIRDYNYGKISLKKKEDEIKAYKKLQQIIKGETFIDIYITYFIIFMAFVLGVIKAIYW